MSHGPEHGPAPLHATVPIEHASSAIATGLVMALFGFLQAIHPESVQFNPQAEHGH